MKEPPQDLAGLFDATLQDGPGDARIAEGRERLAAAAQAAPRRRRMRAAAASSAAALAVAAAVLLLVVGEPQGDPECLWDGQPCRPGAWMQGGSIAFEDGSRVRLDPATRARLVSFDGSDVTIDLHEGALVAAVEPTRTARWVFTAGPHAVHVKGTVLRIAWAAEAQELTVQVDEGEVEVRGTRQVVEERWSVVAGQRLRAGATSVSLDATRESAPVNPPEPSRVDEGFEPGGEEVHPSTGGSDEPVAGPRAARARRPREAVAGRGAPDWRALFREGQFAEAYENAIPAGLEAFVSEAPPRDLLLAARAARLSGAANDAMRLLRGLRRLHPSAEEAPDAAFELGRMAQRRGAHRGAARLYGRFLVEAPDDGLAVDAMGRRMEALLAAGETTEAEAVARSYLARYPRGPHASLARSLLPRSP